MRTEHICIYFAVFLLLPASCSKKLDYKFVDDPAIEEVNGLTICWEVGLPDDKKEILRDIVNDMVFVEGGCFSMGVDQAYDADSRANESPAHFVRLSDYYICSYELTVAQLAGLIGNDYMISKYNSFLFDYYDWESFVNRLKDYTGLQFDFPTEAQWEYAARGGKHSKNYHYPGSDDWEDVWSDGNEGSTASIPNELGLFNMADSYSEWCKDVYSEYGSSASIDPCNLFVSSSENVLYNVVRGGCSESNTVGKYWEKEGKRTAYFNYLKNDYRLCRSTARTYYVGRSGDIILRPVINITDDEK